MICLLTKISSPSRRSALHVVLGSFVLGALLTSTMSAEETCSADGTLTNYKNIRDNNFLFSFNVASDQCKKYGCDGNIHFAIRYHYVGESSGFVDHTLVHYYIEAGHSRTNVAIEHSVIDIGGLKKVEIDAVLPEEVTCSSP